MERLGQAAQQYRHCAALHDNRLRKVYAMITETLPVPTEPGKILLGPVHKLNQLGAANVEKLTSLQIDSVKRYSQLGMRQFSAAAKVNDFKSLQVFMGQQIDATILKGWWLFRLSDLAST